MKRTVESGVEMDLISFLRKHGTCSYEYVRMLYKRATVGKLESMSSRGMIGKKVNDWGVEVYFVDPKKKLK
jgi:hypothetical protein